MAPKEPLKSAMKKSNATTKNVQLDRTKDARVDKMRRRAGSTSSSLGRKKLSTARHVAITEPVLHEAPTTADNSTTEGHIASTSTEQPTAPADDGRTTLVRVQGRTDDDVAATQDARIIKSWPVARRTVSRGLVNAGAWCYRTSSYQALLHCPEFVNFLNSCSTRCKIGPSLCTICAFRRLAFAYWAKGRFLDAKLERLDEMVNQTLARGEAGAGWGIKVRQQDAGEFLNTLLGYLLRDAKQHAGAEDLARALFQARFRQQQRCTQCQDVSASSTEEAFVITSSTSTQDDVPFTLSDTLDDYCNSKVDSQVCESEACRSRSERRTGTVIQEKRFSQAPEILAIQLPIVTWRSGQGVKRMTKVSYPDVLDLHHLREDSQPLSFNLRAVVAHIGPDPGAGHYINVVKESNDTHSTVSDRIVHQCASLDVGQHRLMSPVLIETVEPAQPFMLLYTKVE